MNYFRFLVEEGRAGMPKMMTVGLHCRLAQPGRVSGLAEFIDFAKKYKDVWICTREDIADFWRKPTVGEEASKIPNEQQKKGRN
jgi:peptidoglycan/xylan/chitin deacetylase (PgdA/CDA1 family)